MAQSIKIKANWSQFATLNVLLFFKNSSWGRILVVLFCRAVILFNIVFTV